MGEKICALVPKGVDVGFYRAAAGAELNAVVEIGSKKCGFEIKFSSAPTVTKAFLQACQDVGVQHAYVVALMQQGWSMKPGARRTRPI